MREYFLLSIAAIELLSLSACNREQQSEETKKVCDANINFENCMRKKFPIGSKASVSHKFLLAAGFKIFDPSFGRCREYVRPQRNLSPDRIFVAIAEKNGVIDYYYFRGAYPRVQNHC